MTKQIPISKIQILKTVRNLGLPLLLILISLFSLSTVFPVHSKTLDEVEKEIEEKQQELENLENELENAKESVTYYESAKNNSGTELEKVENEIKQIEAEMEVNVAELEKYKQEIVLLELEQSQQEFVMNDRMIDYYIYNRQGVIDVFVENGEVDGFWKDYKYRETLLDSDLEGITSIVNDIEKLQQEKDKYESSITVLEEENERLANKKDELVKQIAYLGAMASYNVNKQSGIRSQMGAVQQEIEGLTEEQRRIIDEEKGIIADAHGGTLPLQPGEYYFYGQGRSLYQGHGLGFSQYGSFGGALSEMSADSIASFYYQGSHIATASGSVNVIGYGVMNVEDYVSGIGEVPDKACGTQQQVDSRPDKYALDNPGTIWDCWPEESIKSQVIVARSYGLAYGGPICTSAACQVYKGGQGKRWAADETSGKVVKVGGTIIKAYYSSDNNNGWGTATHRNPAWCWDFAGNCGGGFSWLQSVNDSSFAAKGPYTDWIWRTNSYSLSELQSMFEWYAGRGYYNSSNVAQVLNTIGSLQGFQMQRDASGRVARITAVGSNGSSTINGEIFKEIFNIWVGNVVPSGEVDPIFSVTYHFRKV
ncbi:SpoIID/LytB domain-containing protein [Patescibacteria group bacterium]